MLRLKISLLSLVLAGLAGLSACTTTGDGDEQEKVLAQLRGSWDSGCTKDDNGAYVRQIVSITDNEISSEIRSFTDKRCNELALTIDYVESYTLGATRADASWPASPVATLIDLTLKRRHMTLSTLEPTKLAAAVRNTCRNAAKDVHWQIGKSEDLTSINCFPPWPQTFQIVHVQDNVLRFGELNNITTGQTENTRPAYLSSRLAYRKTMSY